MELVKPLRKLIFGTGKCGFVKKRQKNREKNRIILA